MKKYFNDPRPLILRYTGKCTECGTTLKKAQMPITVLPMANSFVHPVEIPSISNSYQQQLIYQVIGNPNAS